MIHTTSWPYANEIGITEKLSCLLVLGGGCAISLNHPLRQPREVCADYFK